MGKILSSLITLLMLFYTANAQKADFTYTTNTGSFCSPQSITFTQNCTGKPIHYLWKFGNGERGSGPTNTVQFFSPGMYNVTLLVIYDTTAATISKTIIIDPTPTIKLTSDRNNLCKEGNVKLTVSSNVPLMKYEWSFDDTITQVTPLNTMSHTFSNFGTSTVKVIATTDKGCIDSTSYIVTISKFPLSAKLDSTKGCIPASIAFTASSTFPSGDGLKNINWDFGDGSAKINTAVNTAKHIYNITDTITKAKIIATSLQGCTNEFAFSPFAYGTPPYNTTLIIKDKADSFCASKNIAFIAKAKNANQYEWSFGDGSKTTTRDTIVFHKYRKLGTQKVTVTPLFNGCKGEKDSVIVFIKSPIGDYKFGNTCGSKNAFYFTNTSVGDISNYEWTFSENKIVKDTINNNTTYTFPVAGSFESQLIVNNAANGCSDTIIKKIFTATPSFISSDIKVCKDSAISFATVNTYDSLSEFQYEFHVTGTVSNNGTDSVLNINPSTFGYFPNFVTIKDGNNLTCDDTLLLSSQVLVRGPVVDFNAPPALCLDTALTFTNKSHPFIPSDNIVDWRWSYGDGIQDSVQYPLPHFYKYGAEFLISLTATDINNCRQIRYQRVKLNPLPILSVFPRADTICLNSSCQLRAFTLDSLTWLPAPNLQCNQCDTIEVSPASSSIFIASSINDKGCKSYDTSFVKVNLPMPFKIFPADTTVCLGNSVQFHSTGGGIITWEPPQFLNSSFIKNPVASPSSLITYRVINKDSAECFVDTSYVTIDTYSLPQVNAGENKIVPYNSSFTLSPSYGKNIEQYLWTPSIDLYCTNCPAPSGIAINNTTYRIEATDIHGCKAWDSVYVGIVCDKNNLLMPTAFTPNGDGLNDYFYPIARGYKNVRSFTIFNRYGKKVFERKNFLPNVASLGWGGASAESKGNETFVWFIQAECSQGEIITSRGTVLLIR